MSTDNPPASVPNPPAFPQSDESCAFDGAEGMTLRDYFAAAALPAIWAGMPTVSNDTACQMSAIAAYNLADAMLTYRAKPTKESE